MTALTSASSPVHPNAIVVAIVALITAFALGMRHSIWAGVGFGMVALVFTVVVNQILVRRSRRE